VPDKVAGSGNYSLSLFTTIQAILGYITQISKYYKPFSFQLLKFIFGANVTKQNKLACKAGLPGWILLT
jgi:hypothetical protein